MALSARASGRDKSTLTPVLRDLGKGHFIARRPTANDGRSYSLFLTPAGQAKLAKLAGHAADHDRVLDDIVGENKAETHRASAPHLDGPRLIATTTRCRARRPRSRFRSVQSVHGRSVSSSCPCLQYNKLA